MLPCWENKEYKTNQQQTNKQRYGSAILCNITVILVWSEHRYLLIKGISARFFGSSIIITHFYQCHEMHFLLSWCVCVNVCEEEKEKKRKKRSLQCGVVIKRVREWERESMCTFCFFFSFLFSLYFSIIYFIKRPSFINAVVFVFVVAFFLFPPLETKTKWAHLRHFFKNIITRGFLFVSLCVFLFCFVVVVFLMYFLGKFLLNWWTRRVRFYVCFITQISFSHLKQMCAGLFQISERCMLTTLQIRKQATLSLFRSVWTL